MNTTFEKIQYGIVGTLSLAATIFLVTTYFNWYTPPVHLFHST
ncbi:hypothetical protein [Gracilibacillus boraciitolerans]|nr:hypothetical protein [Gracilibacillus boraciitolerans]